MKKIFIVIGIVLLVAGVGIYLYLQDLKSGVTNSGALPPVGQEFPEEGRDHIPVGTKVIYKTNPPTSGNHYAEPANWGVYDHTLPDEQLVHNLEHGGIWISYKDIDPETKAKLEDIAHRYPDALVLEPRPTNDAKIALASWTRLEKLDIFDRAKIENFITHNLNKSPEPIAGTGKSMTPR